MVWSDRDHCHYFYLEQPGKKLSRGYRADELADGLGDKLGELAAEPPLGSFALEPSRVDGRLVSRHEANTERAGRGDRELGGALVVDAPELALDDHVREAVDKRIRGEQQLVERHLGDFAGGLTRFELAALLGEHAPPFVALLCRQALADTGDRHRAEVLGVRDREHHVRDAGRAEPLERITVGASRPRRQSSRQPLPDSAQRRRAARPCL